MFDIMIITGVSTCANCGRRLVRAHGSSGRERWHHDENGREECPGAPKAEPTEVVTAEHNHPLDFRSAPFGECPACDLYHHGGRQPWP